MASIEVVILALQWCTPACRPFRKWYLPLGISILVVEILEAITWLYIEPLKNRLDGSDECHVINQAAVTLQGMNVMWQGLWFLLPSMRAGTEQKYFRELRVLMILVGIFGGLRSFPFILAYLIPVGGDECQPGAIVGFAYHISCAYLGPHGHQLWQWAQSTTWVELSSAPCAYCFVILYLGFFLFEDKVEAINLFLFTTYYGVLFYIWGHEAASLWCFSGIELDLFYLIYPLLKDRFGWKGISTWQDLFLPSGQASSDGTASSDEEFRVPSSESQASSYGKVNGGAEPVGHISPA